MSVTIGNTSYDKKWIETLIKGSKNLISPEIDYVLETVFYDVACNLKADQPHYRAVLNYVNSDIIWFAIRYRIPDIYIKMVGLGKQLNNTKFNKIKGWNRKTFNE
jgi:hypothetical protein